MIYNLYIRNTVCSKYIRFIIHNLYIKYNNNNNNNN